MGFARTALLLAAMTGLFLAIGFLIGGEVGMALAFIVALGLNFFAWWNSGNMVLRMHKAREVDETSAPDYVRIVRRLAQNADLPVPRTFIIDSPQPNAFATGRNPANAAVAASSGLLQSLTSEELAGVMAHELAHVKNRDTLTMTITATFAGAIAMLANFAFFFSRGRRGGLLGGLAIMILAPLAAGLVQMAISRSREYEADRIGAQICGRPLWLASALQKLEAGAARTRNEAAEANPATAHLFIVNPLRSAGSRGGMRANKLFSTHPDMATRIARLHEMAADQSGHQSAATGPWG